MRRGDHIKEAGTTGSRPVEGGPLAIYEVAAGQPFVLCGGRSVPTFYFLMAGEVHIEKAGTVYPLVCRELFAVLPNRQLKGRAMSDTVIVGCSLNAEFGGLSCDQVGPALLADAKPTLFQTLAIHPLLFEEIWLYVRGRRDGKIPYGPYLHLKHEQVLLLLREIYPADVLASLCR